MLCSMGVEPLPRPGAYQVDTVQYDSGGAKHLDGQNNAAIPQVRAQVQCLCDADVQVEGEGTDVGCE